MNTFLCTVLRIGVVFSFSSTSNWSTCILRDGWSYNLRMAGILFLSFIYCMRLIYRQFLCQMKENFRGHVSAFSEYGCLPAMTNAHGSIVGRLQSFSCTSLVTHTLPVTLRGIKCIFFYLNLQRLLFRSLNHRSGICFRYQTVSVFICIYRKAKFYL